MAELTVRTLRDDERVDAARVVNHGMLGSVADDVNGAWGEIIEAARAHGAYSSESELVGLRASSPPTSPCQGARCEPLASPRWPCSRTTAARGTSPA